MLHSGSRGIGNKLGTYFIELARKDMERWMIRLPDKDLAYFPTGTEHFQAYWEAVNWAQDYARINRVLMRDRLFLAMRIALSRDVFFIPGEVVSCHHNYVAQENHFGRDVFVTRKGAVRAGKGDLGIIPGSMGTRSYIVRGLGNPESFNSCSHGAGRAMSRSAARQLFTVEDLEASTFGVECRKDSGVLDEAPGAYKDVDQVMAAQTDLVEPVHVLKQVVCVKG
jgi:tRNA-splicing ligase RtcB